MPSPAAPTTSRASAAMIHADEDPVPVLGKPLAVCWGGSMPVPGSSGPPGPNDSTVLTNVGVSSEAGVSVDATEVGVSGRGVGVEGTFVGL